MLTENKKAPELTEEQQLKMAQLENAQLKVEAVLRETVVEDLTQENTELEKRANTAEELAYDRALFIANMSHELRTPMNSIIGFAELIKSDEDATAKEKNGFAEIIENNGYVLLRLVNDIVDVAKMGVDQFKIDKKDFNTKDFFLRMKKEFEKEKKRKKENDNINISFSEESSLYFRLHADETRLQQVFSNLFSNALKFTDQGEISIRCEKQDGEMLFSVKDTGTGIDPAYQSKLFESFSQDKTTIKRNDEGTGLGLAISRGIVEKHGGKMWVESEVGKGSTFFFTIPVEKIEEESE